jgi:hypothetical protein
MLRSTLSVDSLTVLTQKPRQIYPYHKQAYTITSKSVWDQAVPLCPLGLSAAPLLEMLFGSPLASDNPITVPSIDGDKLPYLGVFVILVLWVDRALASHQAHLRG